MYLLFLIFIVKASAEDVSISADLLLKDVTAYMRTMNLTYIKLPKFSKLAVDCEPGEFGNISSLYRTSLISLDNTDRQADFHGQLGFRNLFVLYENCKILKLFKQDFKIKIPNLKIYIKLIITRIGQTCHGRLGDLKLDFDKVEFSSKKSRFFGMVEKILVKIYLLFNKRNLLLKFENEIRSFAKKYNGGYICSN